MKHGGLMGIGAVERETGILKETLRMWERRYGFPQPCRTAAGDRAYKTDDIAKLRLLKRLLDQGFRPGEIVAQTFDELLDIAQSLPGGGQTATDGKLAPELALFKAGGIHEFRSWLLQESRQHEMPDFILGVIQPLCEAIGLGWQNGDIAVFEEHLLTEQIADVLRGAITNLVPSAQPPRILLTTLPQERHSLGLLMLEGLLSAHGISCLSLGLETPIGEIVKCANAQLIDVVALSVSAYYPARKVRSDLRELRASLPGPTIIWAGGAAIRRIRTKLRGIILLPELPDALTSVLDQDRDRGGEPSNLEEASGRGWRATNR
jgi:methanogenic corrinoid protein MtbC1